MKVVAKKKLIEVALPLDAINAASRSERPVARGGHPSGLHPWWARRPLAAARAVIFAQMVDDPSANPDLFPTEGDQERERKRLFDIIQELVPWENTRNETVLEKAREEIWQSWRRACAENANHPLAKELFDRHVLPAFYDPFAGGGSLPLEAQRLGLEAHASDLNPLAVLINKAMIEIPPKFAGQPPVNPESHAGQAKMGVAWRGAQGLAEDVRYYGRWMRDEAEKSIGHLYPKVRVTEEMAADRPDLAGYVGRELTVIAWLWARTVRSPNPAFADVQVPLASTFVLSRRKGRQAYVQPETQAGGYRFRVEAGEPPAEAPHGTKLGRGANFRCLMSGTPISGDHIKAEGQAKRMGVRLMAIVAEGDSERVYLAPTAEHEARAAEAEPQWRPETPLPDDPRNFWTVQYGLTTFGDLFTDRQLAALTTFSDLVAQARDRIRRDGVAAGLQDSGAPLREGGTGAGAYAEAGAIYLTMAVSKEAVFLGTQARWRAGEGKSAPGLGRQALPMVWDYAEVNPFAGAGGDFFGIIAGTRDILRELPQTAIGHATQADAIDQVTSLNKVVSTDPPYYDNISYADLSDFFYVWLRHPLRTSYPDLLATLASPKSEELVASPYRHGSKERAEEFFLDGMTQAMHRLADGTHPAFPVTIYYAFKQAERKDGSGVASTGWATFLGAVMEAGWSITGTWPVRTENATKLLAQNANALASSIALACRPRPVNAPAATRREFQTALRSELPSALADLQGANIAPVDLAQASIGPGMAVFTRYSEVLNADGSKMTVGDALALINETLDEVLEEQEGDFDADSRWALTWFDAHGYTGGEYGEAETLSKAKNTSVDGLVRAGVVKSSRGAVRILKPAELDSGWDPATDSRLTVWEMTQHLIHALESGGEQAAGELAAKLGTQAEAARDLAYRLYLVSERKRRAADALAYNGLVQSWPEIVRIAGERRAATPVQGALSLDNA